MQWAEKCVLYTMCVYGRDDDVRNHILQYYYYYNHILQYVWCF